jgi:hypothetical protein
MSEFRVTCDGHAYLLFTHTSSLALPLFQKKSASERRAGRMGLAPIAAESMGQREAAAAGPPTQQHTPPTQQHTPPTQQHTPPPQAMGVDGMVTGAEQHCVSHAFTVTAPQPKAQLESLHIPTCMHRSTLVALV